MSKPSNNDYTRYLRPQDRGDSHQDVDPSPRPSRGRSPQRNREERSRGRSCDSYGQRNTNHDRYIGNRSGRGHYNRSTGRDYAVPPSYSHRSRSCDPRPRAYLHPPHNTQQSNSSQSRKRNHSSDPHHQKHPNNVQPHHRHGSTRDRGLKDIHPETNVSKDESYEHNYPLALSRNNEANMYQASAKSSKHIDASRVDKENRLNTYYGCNDGQRSPLRHSSTSHERHLRPLVSRQDLPSRAQFQQRIKVPRFNDNHTIPDLIWIAHNHLAILPPSAIAAFWNKVSKQMRNSTNTHRPNHHEDLSLCLHQILERTMSNLEQFSGKDLTQTIYSMAKITCTLRMNERHAFGDVLKGCFLTSDNSLKKDLFQSLALASKDKLIDFDARGISNLAYSYALIGYVPKFGDKSDLFNDIATYAAKLITQFNSQDIANFVWAYAKAGVSHLQIFNKVAEHIVASNVLDRFNSQGIANFVWAYAKVDVFHSEIYEKVAEHIVAPNVLDQFNSQGLANLVCAYAKAGIHYPGMFEKVADHIVTSNVLKQFNSQGLANLVCAYAKAGIHYPELFEKVAQHIVGSNVLNRSNSQELANTVWAYATMGILNKQLFSSIAFKASKLIDSFNAQNLANTAWAYAVAVVNVPTLFNDDFIAACVEKIDESSVEQLLQLHQWHLWQTREMSRNGLPEALKNLCFKAFVSRDTNESTLQKNVVAQLSAIGLDPEEEFVLDGGSGYSIDAIVKVDRRTIGVEVDGPSHFIGRNKSPRGSTILKRRQVQAIDGIELVSVPYWEWDALGSDERKEEEYLRRLLKL